MTELKITSHIGRDILQSAQSFRTPEAAVWEYVVNALQYVTTGITPQVDVVLDEKARTVTIADNGTGMDSDVLQHFLTMHAENRERRRGVPGRGKFGTGKSAAFGIGTALTVETVHDGLRNTIYVDRAMIEAADGAAVPVDFREQDVPVPGVPNGTVITISGVKVKLHRSPVVELIERHLSAFHAVSPVVTVNTTVCEIPRPHVSLTRAFDPPPSLAGVLGDIKLTVNAAVAPLEPTHRGVQVSVGAGNLVAIETAGVDSKEYGNRLFGEVDCPALDDPKYDPVAAYGSNRDLALNKAHPAARALTAFIGSSLEQVRAELVEEGKKARADADAKRLRQTTNAIQSVLNADMDGVRERLDGTAMTNIRQRTRMPAAAAGDEPDEKSLTLDPAGEQTGEQTGTLGENVTHGDPNPNPGTHKPPAGPDDEGGEDASPAAQVTPDGPEKVAPAGGTGTSRPRGGLQVESEHLGSENDRYHWEKSSRVITINLDHPVVQAARALPDDEATYRRLFWEIAFTAYAIALADLYLERDGAMDAGDAMFEVRAALARVWRNNALGLFAG